MRYRLPIKPTRTLFRPVRALPSAPQRHSHFTRYDPEVDIFTQDLGAEETGSTIPGTTRTPLSESRQALRTIGSDIIALIDTGDLVIDKP